MNEIIIIILLAQQILEVSYEIYSLTCSIIYLHQRQITKYTIILFTSTEGAAVMAQSALLELFKQYTFHQGETFLPKPRGPAVRDVGFCPASNDSSCRHLRTMDRLEFPVFRRPYLYESRGTKLAPISDNLQNTSMYMTSSTASLHS